jgi:hypothetical protein
MNLRRWKSASLLAAGTAKLVQEYCEGVSQMFRGVYNMYVAAARARIAQLPKLLSKMPAGLVTFVDSYLGKTTTSSPPGSRTVRAG